MLDKIATHFTTLLGSLMLLLLTVFAGLACIMMVGPYLDRALPAMPAVWLYTVLTAIPGFLMFRGVARWAEAQHPELRSGAMRAMRITPVMALITLVVVWLVQESRSPWTGTGVPEAFWILMVCFGALGSEVLLWKHRPSRIDVAVT